ncbi:hypothetical protein [Planomicrobium okeanokoites]|uniref:hypothetical protein n=1 Tax=Planomicrobium okeanokoites TaxID=244 RepID=UPI000A004578|nr:hypothetical protein [Planomicrobium okeanokoites]
MKSKASFIITLSIINMVLLIFGFWGDTIWRISEPILKWIFSRLWWLIISILIFLALYAILKTKVVESFLHKYTPKLVMGIIGVYMLGWVFTFSYTSTYYLPLMNDERKYTKADEYIYLFTGTMNFFLAIAAFLSLYALTDNLKKEREKAEN